MLYTWEHLPYRAVLKSGHETADLGSSIHTFICGFKLPPSAVLWSRWQTADLGSSMAGFGHTGSFCPQTADQSSSMAAFGPLSKFYFMVPLANCWPKQFHGRFWAQRWQTADLSSSMAGFGHPGGKCAQTADRGSSMAAFGPLEKAAIELLTVAVLWPLSANCWPWQFYGQFWDLQKLTIILIIILKKCWQILGILMVKLY